MQFANCDYLCSQSEWPREAFNVKSYWKHLVQKSTLQSLLWLANKHKCNSTNKVDNKATTIQTFQHGNDQIVSRWQWQI